MEARTEKGRSNLYAMTCHIIMDVTLLLAYALETFVKKERQLWYFTVVAVLAIAPIVIEYVFYKKNQDTNMVKHGIGYGFALFYTFLLFTANSPLTFTYVILMIMIIAVFNDKAFSIKVNIGVVVLNIIHVVIGITTHKMGFLNLASSEIQIALILMMAGFSVVQARVLDKNNGIKLNKIKEQQEKSEENYKNTMNTVEYMTANISDMVVKIEELVKTTAYTKSAMEEVTQGSTDMAEAVQNQLQQTQTIQYNLSEVDSAAGSLQEEMDVTKTEIESGKVNMDSMVEKVNDTVNSGREVTEELETLDEKIQEMNSIVGIINGITSRTALLALNASIEAARAGEAGRGFSVVAGEISNMATQTKDATVHITELIGNVSSAIARVVTLIREMIEGINREKEITESTANSFAAITKSSNVMDENVKKLTVVLEALIGANTDIIDSISTISGVSEEVCAHANETLSAEEDNEVRLSDISKLVTEIKELTNKL